MPDEILVKYCSPTLAGLKTGNLVMTDYESKDEMTEDIRSVNRRLSGKGLRALPLRYCGKRAMVYLYRPSKLRCDLSKAEAERLLRERGYLCKTPEECIRHLIERLNAGMEFPHEIGLFLGYPPEDVRGFIENHAGNYKCVGDWKVYGDAEKARRIFSCHRKCTAIYCAQWKKGKSVEQLTVAV